MNATPLTPANGATLPTQASSTLAFEFQGSVPHGVGATVEVSEYPTLGQDGTLADDLHYGIGYLNQRDSDPSRWAGAATIAYLHTPGTYYYQCSAWVLDYYGQTTPNACPDSGLYGGSCTFASAVYSFSVAAPQPAPAPQVIPKPQPYPPQVWPTTPTKESKKVPRPLSASAARNAARGYAGVAWDARSPKTVCHRVSSNRMTCRVTWRTAKKQKRGHTVKVVRMSGTGITAYR